MSNFKKYLDEKLNKDEEKIAKILMKLSKEYDIEPEKVLKMVDKNKLSFLKKYFEK